MLNDWFCLDCGHRGPRRMASRWIITALLAPGVLSLVATMQATADPHSGPLAAFGLLIGLAIAAALLLPAIAYRLWASRKRCALCGHKRIVPSQSPAAIAATAASN